MFSPYQPLYVRPYSSPYTPFHARAIYDFTRRAELPDGATLTRASDNGTYFDHLGALQVAGENVARFTHNPATGALRGLLVEPERTNFFADNSTFAGLVAGSPGTQPTITSIAMASATRTINAVATENGIPALDYSWAGTPSGNAFTVFPSNTGIAAVSGETFVASAFTKRQSGDDANLAGYQLRMRGVNSGNSEVESSNVTITPNGNALATQWAQIAHTMANGNTAAASGYLRTAWNGSGAVAFGIRIGGMQVEEASEASSTILTSGTAATRAVDVLTLDVPDGIYAIEIVRENGTTNVAAEAVVGGYIVPTSVSPLQSVTLTKIASLTYIFNQSTVLPANVTLTRASANGTFFDASGVMQTADADIPRFTHDMTTGELLGMLVEPERTNLALQSGNITSTSPYFAIAGLSPAVSGSAGTAPDGTNSLTSITFSGQFQNLVQTIATESGQLYALSLYAQNIDGNTAMSFVTADSATGNDQLLPGGLTASLARYSVNLLGDSDGPTVAPGLQDRNASGFGECLAWGYQFEAIETGETASSYIPTTATSETRAADVVTINVPDDTYDIEIVRASGTTNLSSEVVSGGFVVPTDVSPLQRIRFTK